MARRLSTPLAPRLGAPPKYPWHHWSDGSAWRLTRGQDFDIAPTSMAAIIRDYARRNGRRAVAHVRGDIVEFQFAPLPEVAAA